MAAARNDGRSPARDVFGKPGITFAENSLAHPRVIEQRDVADNEPRRAMLSQHPENVRFPNCYLVQQADSKGENLKANRTEVYETLPGPWIYDRLLGPDGIVTETKHRKVLPSTFPVGGTGITRDGVQQYSVTLAEETVVSYTDGSGNLVSPPIYVEEQADPLTAWTSTFKTYRQEQGGASPSFPVIDEVYGTCKLLGGASTSGVDSAVVDAPGLGYTSLPTVTGPTTAPGTGATFTATSLKAVAADLVSGGTIAAGATITFSGGTFSSAATATAGNSSLATIAVNAAGSGYFPGEQITLAGGTPATIPATNTTQYYLQSNSGFIGGGGYAVDDLITIAAGTLSTGSDPIQIVVRSTGSTGNVRSWTSVEGLDTYLYTTNQSTPLTQSATTGTGAGFAFNIPRWRTLLTPIPARSGRAILTVTTGGLNTVGIAAAGSGYVLSVFTPASTTEITLAGGTFTTAAKVKPTKLSLVDALIDDGGIGHAVDDLITMGTFVGGTVYVPAVAKVLTVGGSGEVLTFEITVNGSYSTSDWDPTQSSSTGAGTGFSLNTETWGIAEASVSLAGSYTATGLPFTQASATTVGASGAEFLGAGYTVLAVAIFDAGSYSATVASFTQYSTTGTGTGATFNSATFNLRSLTLLSGGVYTALPSNPVTGTSGAVSITANLSFGLNAISVTAPGTLYPGGNITLTITGGGGTGARGHALASPDGWREQTAVIVDGRMANQPNSPKQMKVWVTMPNAIPPWKEYEQIPTTYPAILVILTESSPYARPAPGYDFTFLPQRQAVDPALTINEGVNGQPSDIPSVFAMISPAAISRYFEVTPNTQHEAFSWFSYTDNGDGTTTIDYPEKFPASTAYVQGQTICVRSGAVRLRGNMWNKRASYLSENGPLY